MLPGRNSMIAKNDRVICRLGIMPEKTVGGIILADTTQKDGQAKINIGKVVDFGPGMKLLSGEFIQGYDGKRGDIICWEQFGGIAYEVVEKGLVCVRNSDIGCVLEPGEYKDWEFDQAEADKKRNKAHEALTKKPEVMLEPRKQKYQCWNNDCSHKTEVVETAVVEPVCEYCGKEMSEYKGGTVGIVH